MGGRSQHSAYSMRARVLALFIILAVILGGGGSPNPSTEVLLEVAFAVAALTWVWLPAGTTANNRSGDPLMLVLIAIVLITPAAQLIPLPPSIWTALPGRANETAALSLVGAQDTWRPISLSPSRTLASLLAIIPAAFCAYGVAALDFRDRRLVLGSIVVVALVSALLGAIQLVSGQSGFNLYRQFHAGWVTGFQANKNAEADVLLMGFLALASFTGMTRSLEPSPDKRPIAILTLGIAVFLLAATVMTGSRAGIALIIVALGAALLIFSVARASGNTQRIRPLLILAALIVAAAFGTYLFTASGNTALGRVAARFAEDPDSRLHIWQDTWFALKHYWPFGFGLGGFEPAMLPAERLEYLDPYVPNRAHNEFLEIGLEAGVWGYLMLIAAVVVCLLLAWRAWRKDPSARVHTLFGLSVLVIIALHSVVDYPLRSMAISCLAGVAAGMLVGTRTPPDRGERMGLGVEGWVPA